MVVVVMVVVVRVMDPGGAVVRDDGRRMGGRLGAQVGWQVNYRKPLKNRKGRLCKVEPDSRRTLSQIQGDDQLVEGGEVLQPLANVTT